MQGHSERNFAKQPASVSFIAGIKPLAQALKGNAVRDLIDGR